MVPRVQAVVEAIAEERRRFDRFCRSLGEEELIRPVPGSDWVVKDFVAHLASYEEPVARWFAAIAGEAEGRPHRGSPDFDIDRYNDAAVAGRRERGVEELLQEAARERAALVAALERVTDAQLDATIRFGGDRKRPAVEVQFGPYLTGWARHTAIHVADMLKALPERRDDPEIVAWLHEPAMAATIAQYQRAMG